jgi:ABC-type antimicrobial peptide transport system permease subunit
MRILLMNHIQNAKQSLQSSRTRSFLTMLGVTIGVASITAILALSGGTNKIISDQINSLGGNIIIVRPGADDKPAPSVTQAQLHDTYATSTLTENDITQLNKTSGIKSASPIMVLTGTIKADSKAPVDSPIVVSTPELADISNLKLHVGQFLDETLDQNTVVVGKQLSINIFGTESSIGRTMTIRGKPFVVVGVLKQLNNPINYNSVDFDNAAIINFAAGKKLNNDVTQIQQINIKADSIDNLDKAVTAADKTITDSHSGEKDFSVLSGDKISQPTSHFFYTVAGVMTAIATISLVVGGIGIMNIMLVTVAERTREIGIRKALGASNIDISWQFIIESLAISIIGGIFGYIGGYILAFSVSGLLTFDPVINWQIAAAALLISIAMGILFGLYPAIRAARKDPIESLNRHS